MKTYIAFLRGINVGGHKKILMKDLSVLFESLGFKNVITYIQSGNVVFEVKEKSTLAKDIEKAILQKYGWEVPVIIKSPSEIEMILKECPFPQVKMEKSHFMLLFETLSEEFSKQINEIDLPYEEIIAINSTIYFFCANGYGRVKFNSNYIEKKLKSKATARNYRTMAKLLELSTS